MALNGTIKFIEYRPVRLRFIRLCANMIGKREVSGSSFVRKDHWSGHYHTLDVFQHTGNRDDIVLWPLVDCQYDPVSSPVLMRGSSHVMV